MISWGTGSVALMAENILLNCVSAAGGEGWPHKTAELPSRTWSWAGSSCPGNGHSPELQQGWALLQGCPGWGCWAGWSCCSLPSEDNLRAGWFWSGWVEPQHCPWPCRARIPPSGCALVLPQLSPQPAPAGLLLLQTQFRMYSVFIHDFCAWAVQRVGFTPSCSLSSLARQSLWTKCPQIPLPWHSFSCSLSDLREESNYWDWSLKLPSWKPIKEILTAIILHFSNIHHKALNFIMKPPQVSAVDSTYLVTSLTWRRLRSFALLSGKSVSALQEYHRIFSPSLAMKMMPQENLQMGFIHS